MCCFVKYIEWLHSEKKKKWNLLKEHELINLFYLCNWSSFTFNVLRISSDQLPNLLSAICGIDKSFMKLFAIPFCVRLHQGVFKNYVEFKWKHKNICECQWMPNSVQSRQNWTHTKKEKPTKNRVVLFWTHMCSSSTRKIELNFVVFLIHISHFSKSLSFDLGPEQQKEAKENKTNVKRIPSIRFKTMFFWK